MTRRARRSSEQGVTLIEMLVAIALITTAVVALVGSVANAEKSAQISTEQTTLEVAMRQVSDYFRAPYNGSSTTTAKYQYCAASYTVPTSIAGTALPTFKSATATVIESSGATRNTGAPPFPLEDCRTGVFAPEQPCTVPAPPTQPNCDWGVQRITITLTLPSGRSLQRVVYKSVAT